jgi:glycosyltransferase involved in cell wall biosynthesis
MPGLTRNLRLPDNFKLSVVIPVFNEEGTIAETIGRIRASALPKEIIVVDDGSTDRTAQVLETLKDDDLGVFVHDRNLGKGAALCTGFARITGSVVIIQDADLEYDPRDYDQLIQPIVKGAADVVYGSRFISAGPSHRPAPRIPRSGPATWYFWHRAANSIVTTLSNIFTGLNLTDVETCYKVFRRDVIEAIAPTLRERGFGVDPEITAKIARRKYRVCETGISYVGRTYKEGKKIGLADAFRVVWCIVRYAWRD